MRNKTNPNDLVNPIDGFQGGLTKREYFASLMFPHLCNANDTSIPARVHALRDALLAVQYADLLIDALNEREGKD